MARAYLFGLLASLSVACAGQSVVGGDSGVSDIVVDTPAKPDVVDAPAVVDAPVDVTTPIDLPPPMDAPDAGPPRCATAAECVGHAGGPACDPATGRCVACTAADDRCPVGQYCLATSFTCAPGCRDDAACTGASTRDGGPTLMRRCDLATRACVDCLADADCPAGTLCVGNVCAAGCTATRPCPTGLACCGGACVDPQANLAHCGACDHRCEVDHGAALCMNAVCAIGRCTAPYDDCDRAAANGCETDTQTSVAHCGGCGLACAARAHSAVACAAGRCAYTCDTGYADCDGDPANGCEVDTRASALHCGGCGRRCDLANATAACVAGACAVDRCADDFGDCDGNAANGCESDLRVSVTHCGACATACPSRPNSLQGCVGRACVLACVSGYQDCDGDATNGCEVDVRTNASHCGGCGRACRVAGGAGACMAGSCSVTSCDAGRGDCDADPTNGCETSTLTTVAHCGGCGRACAARGHATARCDAGACQYDCDAGFADCDGDPSNGCEVDTRTSTTHCGGCGRACRPANAAGVCAAGACGVMACDMGYGDCDGVAATGCEVDTRTSAAHCGGCGRPCASGALCEAGACAAPVLASCAALHAAAPTLPSGVYAIDPDGAGGATAFRVYCDMVTDGGGWTYGAIVRSDTSSESRSRMAGVSAFGAPVARVLDNEYSVSLTGVTFHDVRIDNFTLGRAVVHSATTTLTWTGATYTSDGGLPAKRVTVGTVEFRVGYYLPSYCGLAQTNIPMCFTSPSNPVGWVCDTDSGFVEGWVDATGGEICGMYYCRQLWRDTACVSYNSMVAVYGFAIR